MVPAWVANAYGYSGGSSPSNAGGTPAVGGLVALAILVLILLWAEV